jgi:hypothetical protein
MPRPDREMAKRAITAKNMQGSLVESLRQRDRTVLAVREVRNNMRFTDFIVHFRMDWRSVCRGIDDSCWTVCCGIDGSCWTSNLRMAESKSSYFA